MNPTQTTHIVLKIKRYSSTVLSFELRSTALASDGKLSRNKGKGKILKEKVDECKHAHCNVRIVKPCH